MVEPLADKMKQYAKAARKYPKKDAKELARSKFVHLFELRVGACVGVGVYGD